MKNWIEKCHRKIIRNSSVFNLQLVFTVSGPWLYIWALCSIPNLDRMYKYFSTASQWMYHKQVSCARESHSWWSYVRKDIAVKRYHRTFQTEAFSYTPAFLGPLARHQRSIREFLDSVYHWHFRFLLFTRILQLIRNTSLKFPTCVEFCKVCFCLAPELCKHKTPVPCDVYNIIPARRQCWNWWLCRWTQCNDTWVLRSKCGSKRRAGNYCSTKKGDAIHDEGADVYELAFQDIPQSMCKCTCKNACQWLSESDKEHFVPERIKKQLYSRCISFDSAVAVTIQRFILWKNYYSLFYVLMGCY